MQALPLILVLLFVLLSVLALKREGRKYAPAAPHLNSVAGVGGWLLWLIFSLTVLGPLAGIGQLASEIASAERAASHLKDNELWRNYKCNRPGITPCPVRQMSLARRPPMRQQLLNPACRLRRQPRQHVAQVRMRVEPVQLC